MARRFYLRGDDVQPALLLQLFERASILLGSATTLTNIVWTHIVCFICSCDLRRRAREHCQSARGTGLTTDEVLYIEDLLALDPVYAGGLEL